MSVRVVPFGVQIIDRWARALRHDALQGSLAIFPSACPGLSISDPLAYLSIHPSYRRSSYTHARTHAWWMQRARHAVPARASICIHPPYRRHEHTTPA